MNNTISFNVADNNILYLYPYFPKKYGTFDKISQEIRRYKEGYPWSVNEFSTDLEDAFDNWEKKTGEEIMGSVIFTVPSHAENSWSSSLTATAGYLSVIYNLFNESTGIVRVKEQKKLAYGGDRSFDSIINSMSIKSETRNIIKYKNAIVLDDVTTSGNTLLACKKLLEIAHANSVTLVAIAKTMYL